MEISSWDAAAIIAKVLTYAFSLTSAGGAIFLLVFWRHLHEDERLSIVRSTSLLAGFALVLTAVRLPILAGTMGGDLASMSDSSLLQFAFQSSEGHAAMLRIAGLGLILVLVFGRSWALGIAMIGACLVAFSFAFTGHSLSIERGILPRVLVAAHLLGVCYWVGAFYPLMMLTRVSDLPRIALIMTRFGEIAAFAVGALIVAGVLLLWFLLETPWAIFESSYGGLVALKLLLVVGLLSMAAMNKLMFTPALAAGDASALRRLRKSISAELALAGAVLIVTATFTTVTGPPALESRVSSHTLERT